MPSLNQKLADSLSNLKKLSGDPSRRVFKSTDLSRTDRERLTEAGFLTEIIKGWVMTTRPADRQGGTYADRRDDNATPDGGSSAPDDPQLADRRDEPGPTR